MPAGLEFLKFEPAVFSRFALVPGVEAPFAATHYDEHTGLLRCLGGDDPVCCTEYGDVAAGSVAIAFFALSYSIAPRAPGMVGFDATVSKCPWCSFTDAELQESCQAWMSAIGARSSAAN